MGSIIRSSSGGGGRRSVLPPSTTTAAASAAAQKAAPYFVVPKGLSGLLHACQGVEFNEDDDMAHVQAVATHHRLIPASSLMSSDAVGAAGASGGLLSSFNSSGSIPQWSGRPPAAKSGAKATQATDDSAEAQYDVMTASGKQRRRRSNLSSFYPLHMVEAANAAGVGGVAGVASPSKGDLKRLDPVQLAQHTVSSIDGSETVDDDEDRAARAEGGLLDAGLAAPSVYHRSNLSSKVINAYNLSYFIANNIGDYSEHDGDVAGGPPGSGGVSRRQKKNKKLFHLLLLDMENHAGHYAGTCSATYPRPASAVGSYPRVKEKDKDKPSAAAAAASAAAASRLEEIPILEISDPISIKGVVALTSQRFRIQLNAFQNERKKFSRNCNDLHEALWIFEVTLLISDGPKSLEGQLKIGNYFPLCHLGHRFLLYQTPLEYLVELCRQVTGFLHRAEVFPYDLIHLAVSYLDHMTMGPKELMSEEELQLSEDILATYHPQLVPMWTPMIRAFREKDRMLCEVLAEHSGGAVTSVLQLMPSADAPSLMRIPKLVMQLLPEGGGSAEELFRSGTYSASNLAGGRRASSGKGKKKGAQSDEDDEDDAADDDDADGAARTADSAAAVEGVGVLMDMLARGGGGGGGSAAPSAAPATAALTASSAAPTVASDAESPAASGAAVAPSGPPSSVAGSVAPATAAAPTGPPRAPVTTTVAPAAAASSGAAPKPKPPKKPRAKPPTGPSAGASPALALAMASVPPTATAAAAVGARLLMTGGSQPSGGVSHAPPTTATLVPLQWVGGGAATARGAPSSVVAVPQHSLLAQATPMGLPVLAPAGGAHGAVQQPTMAAMPPGAVMLAGGTIVTPVIRRADGLIVTPVATKSSGPSAGPAAGPVSTSSSAISSDTSSGTSGVAVALAAPPQRLPSLAASTARYVSPRSIAPPAPARSSGADDGAVRALARLIDVDSSSSGVSSSSGGGGGAGAASELPPSLA